jgi:hypothetical protein
MQLGVGGRIGAPILSLSLQPYFLSDFSFAFYSLQQGNILAFSMFMSRAFSKPDNSENPEELTNFGLTPWLIVELSIFF